MYYSVLVETIDMIAIIEFKKILYIHYVYEQYIVHIFNTQFNWNCANDVTMH